MKLNENGKRCYSIGEVVRVDGTEYRFTAIDPDKELGCELYETRHFCDECGGCRTRKSLRGHFRMVGW